MANEIRDQLPEHPPLHGESVHAAVEAVYSWNYESEIDQLRTLYANGVERQWSAMRDLNWDAEIDREALARSFSVGGLPVTDTEFWKSLSPETQWEVARRTTAFMLSTFLHGEQGALMTASQLVTAVPHMDGKFYAATQTMDEARHVEVFAAFVKKLDEVYEIPPGLRVILDAILGAENWMMKAVGMNIVLEGLALYSFRDMRGQTAEPLLQQILTYVGRDEARHTAYGIKYLSHLTPHLSDAERGELEDFAYEAARQLIDQRSGVSMRQTMTKVWAEAGIDPMEAISSIVKDQDFLKRSMRQRGGQMGPVHGFVVPTLDAIGLYSDRIRGHFKNMWAANLGSELAEQMATTDAALPSDLEEWINQGFESL